MGKAHVDSGEPVPLNPLHVSWLGFPNADAFPVSWRGEVVIQGVVTYKGRHVLIRKVCGGFPWVPQSMNTHTES